MVGMANVAEPSAIMGTTFVASEPDLNSISVHGRVACSPFLIVTLTVLAVFTVTPKGCETGVRPSPDAVIVNVWLPVANVAPTGKETST